MMHATAVIVVLLACLSGAAVAAPLPAAAAFLPHRFRGGEAWQRVLGAQLAAEAGQAPTGWFTQQLDHTTTGGATFKQRYWVNDTFLSAQQGAVILYICGEGPCGGPPAGFVMDLAKEHRAAVIVLEHRFYGDSVPGNNFTIANLQFLTVDQALHDLAAFLTWYKASLSSPLPAFIIGGSYSGALSAWFRITFPDLVKGSLASSGVVNTIFEFWEFDNQVGLSAGTACANVLRATTKALEAGLAAGKPIKELFRASALPDDDFWYMVADAGAMAVQYGFKADLCGPMLKAQAAGEPLPQAYAAFVAKMWGADFGQNCFYSTSCLKNDPSQWQPTSRAWRWQKCSEMAYLQSAPKEGSIRSTSLTITALVNQCTAVFGNAVDPLAGSQRMLAKYGGAKPAGTNIFFSNGSDDPWQRAAVRATLSPSEPEETAYCNGCGHCGDLGVPSPSNAPSLKEQRANITKYVAKWLAE